MMIQLYCRVILQNIVPVYLEYEAVLTLTSVIEETTALTKYIERTSYKWSILTKQTRKKIISRIFSSDLDIGTIILCCKLAILESGLNITFK